MIRFQHDIEDLSSQLVKERTIVSDLNGTIDGLKEELEKAQGNISNISILKDALESQQQRTNETLRIQVSKLIDMYYTLFASINLSKEVLIGILILNCPSTS